MLLTYFCHIPLGSGGGWNQSLSLDCKYDKNLQIIDESYDSDIGKLYSTGCSLAHSWMGGFSCHTSLVPDTKTPDLKWVGYGGFGGGGGGCQGGGGGGGYIGE